MTVIDKLVYLIKQGVITIDQVAPEYRVAVELALLQSQASTTQSQAIAT